MKINNINNALSVAFTSLRTDKKQVETLKNGSMPITDNQKENIVAALNNMTVDPERKSIEFLLDVAKNLTYGQNGDSEFKDIIDGDSTAPVDRENTDWSGILASTIRIALNASNQDVRDLEAEYEQIFNTKQPLTQEQKEVLDLRAKLTDEIVDSTSLADADALTTTAQVLKNIDFFISSSEVPLSQKKICLEKFIYFLSDDYEINPQLADKKLDAVDEMLEDMVVKTPESTELTKKVNQLYSGICAAISICRKAVAYEDKARYMDLVMQELSTSPVMEVYDITDLSSGNKVSIPKIEIDYNAALDAGYRILDASAHIWMHNAHASGDGTIQTETYTAFDHDNYGIFDDSSWYEGIGEQFAAEKALLKNLIREKENVESVLKIRKKMKDANKEVLVAKKEAREIQSAVSGKLREILTSIFPELSSLETTKLQRDLIKFYTGSKDDNEINISSKMPKEVQQQKIADFISQSVSATPEQVQAVKEKSQSILGLVDEHVQADKNIEKLQTYNTKKGQYTYYKKLFNLAAAHRLAIESDINLNDGVIRFERSSGLPPRDTQITSYMKKLAASFSSETARSRFQKDGVEKTEEELVDELYADIYKIETGYPQKVDAISKIFLGQDIRSFTRILFSNLATAVKNGDSATQEKVAYAFQIKNDKVKVLANIDKWVNKLDENASDADIQEAVRILGFENRIHLLNAFMASFLSSLQEGISQEQYDELAQRFGGEDKIASSIENIRQEIVELITSYEDTLKKWDVPSARVLILQKLEKDQTVLSTRKLKELQSRFDFIRRESSKNESIANIKERKRANEELYTFTSNELDIFNSIEKAFPYMKKYSKIEYQAINQALFDNLEAQYSKIGMLNGQFWVREEGSSGLAANEQVRIIEQMTGKPHHLQRDAQKAAEQVKKGEGSGIASYSVDDASYAFHAQYVPKVTSEAFTDPITGKKEIKDVLWTDNSWGRSEKEYFWNGGNGFKYTDYGQGFGWKDGFIVSDDLLIGQPVSSVKNAIGVNASDGEKFGLFLEMVLPGTPVDAYQKLYKMFGYILTMNQGVEFYSSLEQSLKNGQKLDVEFLDGLDSVVEVKVDQLMKQINSIKSKEDYDKLPEDSYLKFIMQLVSLSLSTANPNLTELVSGVQNLDDLNELTQLFIDTYMEEFGVIVAKTDKMIEKLSTISSPEIEGIFEEASKKFGVEFTKEQKDKIFDDIFFDGEGLQSLDGSINSLEKYLLDKVEEVASANITDKDALLFFVGNTKHVIKDKLDNVFRIKDLDNMMLQNSPVKESFIATIDKYLKPKSDEELLTLLQALQHANYKTVERFFETLTPKDLGLDFADPYEYIQKIQAEDSNVVLAFNNMVAGNVISSLMESGRNSKDDTVTVPGEDGETELALPADLYRNLHVKLADMDVQKYIKQFKAEAFAKYKVRQAFPQPVVIPDSAIVESVDQMMKYIQEQVSAIKANEYLIDIFDEYQSLLDKYGNEEFYTALKSKKSVVISDANSQQIAEFRKDLKAFVEKTKIDSTLSGLTSPLSLLILETLPVNNVIDGRKAAKAISSIEDLFASWASSSVTRDKFVLAKKEELNEINQNISLMVNANIAPNYRNEAFEKVKNIVSLLKRDASQEEIEFYRDDFNIFMVDRHILKNPTVLLKECVQMLQNGQGESDTYDVLRRYLVQALKVAQQTKIQYKLVQNAHEGISSKTKDLLSLFYVSTQDGEKKTMDSEEGMLYLIEQLQNESDNHTTLKLFLAQAGLSKMALNAVMHHFDIKKSTEIIDDSYNSAMVDLKDMTELVSLIDQFTSRSRIQFYSLPNALENLKAFIKRKYSNKESEVYKTYMQYMDSIELQDNIKNLSGRMVLPLLESLNNDIKSTLATNINKKIDFIADVADLMAARYNLLGIIEVPEDSVEYTEREAFKERYNKFHEYAQARMHDIMNYIESTNVLSAEYS